MKKTILSAGLILLVLTGCQQPKIYNNNTEIINNNQSVNSNKQTSKEPEEFTVYAYDSLTAEWGLLPQITAEFEKQNNAKINITSFPDTGTMMNQLILEKDKPKADVVLGLDNIDYVKILSNDLLTPYQSPATSSLDKNLLFDEKGTMTPFDFGYVGFVYDSEKISFTEPISLMDLTRDEYKGKIIIEQPGLSSPGTQLLLWTKAALSESDFNLFWQKMKDNVLTVSPEWSTAYYSLFLQGEAPIVLSYLTSPAYHIDQEQVTKYKAIPIKEGYFRQVEGAGLVKNSAHQKISEKFIDYLLNTDVQNKIPKTQWMFPVNSDSTTWPAAYNQIITPTASQILTVKPDNLKTNYDSWMNTWNQLFNID